MIQVAVFLLLILYFIAGVANFIYINLTTYKKDLKDTTFGYKFLYYHGWFFLIGALTLIWSSLIATGIIGAIKVLT